MRRRELLIAGGTLVTATALPAVAARAQSNDDDVAFLRKAIELEQINAEAYERAAPQLGGIARLFRNQERTHAAALSDALRRLGGGAPQRANVDAALADLGRAGSRQAVARFLIGLEDKAVAAYVDGHKTISDARLMKTVSSILGNQAQHLVALRTITGQQEVPTAFE